MLPVSLPDHLIVLRMPGAPCRVGPQGRSPVRAWPGAAERSGAALIQIRLNSASQVQRVLRRVMRDTRSQKTCGSQSTDRRIRPELGQFSAYLNAGGCGQALRGGGRAGDLRR
jgi:hypothetical protein